MLYNFVRYNFFLFLPISHKTDVNLKFIFENVIFRYIS